MGPVKPPVEVTVKSRDVQQNGSLETRFLRIVHISDTHNGKYGGQLPDGDVLIHSGDFTNAGDEEPQVRLHKGFAEFTCMVLVTSVA